MKKMWKRAGAAIVMAALAAAVFSGCEGENQKKGGVKELSFYVIMPYVAYHPDLPIWREAERLTGIRLINTVADSVTNEDAAFATMLISKRRPDIVLSRNSNLRSMALSQGLIALDTYMDSYAPNLKQFFEECPTARAAATAEDGHIYFVPGTTTDLNQPNTPSTGFFIRRDWLEKLHLNAPTTIDELHDVLYAFRTQDPNGNGEMDEIPYFCREKTLRGLLNLFCTGGGYHEVNGEPVYGPAQEQYRQAMKTLAKWYAEGLIDKEIYTRNSAREQLLGKNLGGCTSDWFSSTGKFNESYADTVPGLRFEPILPPKNIEGKITWPETRGILHELGWGISTDCKEEDIIDAVKYLDFWMSREGCELMAYGVEGLSYTKDESGNIVWSKQASEYPDGIPNYRRSIGFTETGTVGIIEAEKAGMNETSLRGYAMYEGIVEEKAVSNLPYTAEEQAINEKYSGSIYGYMMEMQQRWILGQGNVDAEWEEYLDTLEKMGLGEMNQITQQAYARNRDFLNQQD